ncbi:MAG: 5-formyltetrahydrofolate cyclo-ligase [Pseudomonadota bacterium]
MTLDARKTAARRAAFARRRAAHAGGHPDATGLLRAVLADYCDRPLAGFMPINTEIDPRPAMAEHSETAPVGVPVIDGPGLPLSFARWTPDTRMVEGAFKALIPAERTPLAPEVVVVPLVAFDLSGGRLGYGGGFYDRTLEGLRAAGQIRAIGFAWDVQEADDLPLEPTDQPLDMIVTERRVIEIVP